MEASYVEIYNEQIRDLLRPGADHDEKLTIAAAPAGGCPTVTGVEREIVDSVDCAAGLVRRAAAARYGLGAFPNPNTYVYRSWSNALPP
jgi:kinesin family protein C1